MGFIFKKLFRDIRRGLGQFISMMLVIAVGCFFLAGMSEASYNIDKLVQDYYSEQKLAPVTGGFLVATDEAVELVSRRNGVNAAAGRYQFNTFFTYGGGSSRVDAVVNTLTDGFNEPLIVSGKMPSNDSECIVDSTFAKANNLQVGSSISLFQRTAEKVYLSTTDGSLDQDKVDYENFNVVYTSPSSVNAEYRDLTVSGTFISPEYIYKVNTADSSAVAEEFACIYVNSADMIAPKISFYINKLPFPFFTQNRDELEIKLYNQILVDSADGLDVFDVFDDNVLDTENKMAGIYVEAMSYVKEDGTAYKNFDEAYRQIRNLVIVLPLLFFLVAAVITFISLGKIVDNQRTQIGVMQAVGISKGKVYFGYLMYAGFAAIFGSLLGGIAGAFSLPYIYYLAFGSQFILPPFEMGIGIGWASLGVAVSLAVALLSALISCHRTLKENPAQSMRPRAGKKVKPILIERWKGLWQRFSFGTKMIFRNLLQNKMRVLLSSIGVIASMVLLITGVNLKSRVSYTVNDYLGRIGYDVQITAQNDIENLDDFIADHPQIESATKVVSVNATVSANDERSDILQILVPHDGSFVNLYSDFEKTEKIELSQDSLVLPHYLAEKLNVQKGDTVTVTAVGYRAAELIVTDISYQYLLPNVYAGENLIEKVSAENVTGLVYAKLASGTSIEAGGEIKSALDKEALRARALKMSELLDVFVVIVVIGAAVLAVTVIYNITSINVMERSREIATLLVLGYRKGETGWLIFAENIVITILGCLIGLPLGYGMFYWLAQITSSMNVIIPINLPFLVVLICTVAVFAFSMLATLMMTRKILKIDMVEALKSVE